MKPLRLSVLFLSILIASPAFPASYEQTTKAFSELTDRQLTATGEDALKVYGDAWQHSETEHFVYHFHDAKAAEPVLVAAEAYYQWVKELFGVGTDEEKRKGHIFVFEDKEVWRSFQQRTPEKLPGAEAFTNGFELFIYREPFYLSPQRVLAHEITHLVLFRFVKGKVPLFLNEGFAEFMGTRAMALKADGDDYRVRSFPKIAAEDFIAVPELISLQTYPSGREEVFYRESELLARFLILNEKPEKFHELLKRSADGKDFESALEDLYGMDVEGFAEKFGRYSTAG